MMWIKRFGRLERPVRPGFAGGRTCGWAGFPLLAVTMVGLSGAGTPPAIEAAARIEFAEPVYNFGEIPSGEVVKHTFEFTNTGSAPLEITQVTTSCGCTTAADGDRVVEPGAKGSIPVEFDSRTFTGEILKTVTVISNDPEHATVTLRLTGSIWAPIKITPRSVVFQYDSMSSTGETKVVKIVNNLKEPLVLSAPEWKQAAFRAELEEVMAGREYALHITTVPPVGTGTISAPITLKTSLTTPPRLSVHALAVERQPLVVSPSRISLPTEPLTNVMRPTVTVRVMSETPLSLSEAAVNMPGVEVELEEVEPGKLFRLTPTFPEGFVLRSTPLVELSVKTSHPRRPAIKIPVAPRVFGRAVTRVVPAASVKGD